MAVHKAVPQVFAKMHKRFLTPTVATVTFGLVSILLYVALNFISAGSRHRRLGERTWCDDRLLLRAHRILLRVVRPTHVDQQCEELLRPRGDAPFRGLILYFILGWSFWYYWNPANSYTHLALFGRQIGGTFTLDVGTILLGVILMFTMQAFRPAFFKGQTLNRTTPTLVTQHEATINPGTPA